MSEARLENGVPVTGGWFVINGRDARWQHDEMRTVCRFGGQGEAHFDDLGIGLYWLAPGKPMALYHHEAGQEDFLVLRGSCTLIVEGQDRQLERWDLVHCPPRTAHTIVASGSEPALVLAVGARKQKGSARYPSSRQRSVTAPGSRTSRRRPIRPTRALGTGAPGRRPRSSQRALIWRPGRSSRRAPDPAPRAVASDLLSALLIYCPLRLTSFVSGAKASSQRRANEVRTAGLLDAGDPRPARG